MMRSRLLLTAVIATAAALVTACGKSETNTKTRASGPLQLPEAKLEAKGDSVEANEALKERLARQEAATKLFDKTRAEPPAPAPRAEPVPAPARPEPAVAKAEPQRAAEPVKTAAATPAAPPPAAAPAPAPAPVAAQAQAPAKAPEMVPAKSEPPRAEPARPEPVRLASAAPTTIPAASNNFAAKLVSRVDPEFPREAVHAGAEKGMVKARMTLDGNGNVMRVDIVEANPRRIFDRAVVRALSQWRFSDGPSGRTVESEVEFKR